MNHFYPNEDALMDGAFFNNLPRAVDEFDSVEDQLACGKEPVLASHHSGVGRSNQIVFWGFARNIFRCWIVLNKPIVAMLNRVHSLFKMGL